MHILEHENFYVEAVADGEAALSAAERLRLSLIILDLMFPKLDGFEVCRRLRAENYPAAMIILTIRDEVIDKISDWNLARMSI